MKIAKYILIILTLALWQTKYSQQSNSNSEDKILEEIESSAIHSLLDNEFSKSSKLLFHASSSLGNKTEITHQGNDNHSTVYQNGYENMAILSRLGDNNIDNVDQNGNNNTYNSDIIGDGINNQINQNGTTNLIDQTLVGDGMNFTITQSGNNHELKQVEDDGKTTSYIVNQTGNGMKVTITNRIGLP